MLILGTQELKLQILATVGGMGSDSMLLFMHTGRTKQGKDHVCLFLFC
jgi:hypothetical protein